MECDEKLALLTSYKECLLKNSHQQEDEVKMKKEQWKNAILENILDKLEHTSAEIE